MDRFFDRVIGIAPGRVDMGDRVAGGAGDSRVGHLVAGQVVFRIVEAGLIEFAAEKRNGIVTARAKSGALHAPVPLEKGPA